MDEKIDIRSILRTQILMLVVITFFATNALYAKGSYRLIAIPFFLLDIWDLYSITKTVNELKIGEEKK